MAVRRQGRTQDTSGFTAARVGLIDLGPAGRHPGTRDMHCHRSPCHDPHRHTIRTGEMLPCPGNNLRKACRRTHCHASPHHRVTSFKWSLSLEMSQRSSSQQMTDDFLSDVARYVFQGLIVSSCDAAAPIWEKRHIPHNQQTFSASLDGSTAISRQLSGRCASIKTGLTSMPPPSAIVTDRV